ncbi:MAG: RagB/SusD family nutrient uptake outer membrane protein [Candidatus Nephrothrix sp. EaCA]|nr:MAG: RagB/SusD family nutrient uptake outer membrane protein [Candidatus Nephrothrix sp. EaCA]
MKINRLSKMALATAITAFAACTDLVNKETDSIVRTSSGGFTPGDPAALLESAYKDLEAADAFALGQVCTADLIPPTRGVDWGDNGVWRSIDQHTWDQTHPFMRDSWNTMNQQAYKATEILASNPSPAQKAEAQFLRAFNMFMIMDYFGQVPFREVTQGVEELPKVLSRAEAFDFIAKDLTEALPALEVIGPKYNNGKASKAAANFLLAKLYLNKAVFKSDAPAGPYTFEKADMDKVIACIKAITDNGYSLDPDYFNVFSRNSRAETIFVSNEGVPSTRWYMTLSYAQNPSGWNGFATLANFYDSFENSDIRKGSRGKSDGTLYSGIGLGFLIGQQYDDNGKEVIDYRAKMPLSFSRDVPPTGAATYKGIRVIKYHPANSGKLTFMRYGEAVLMKAEAQLRGGNAAEALATVNNLRRVRKASNFSSLTEDNLFDEIGREIYWEGFRRTVEVRFRKFTSGEGVLKKDSYTVLFPIPLTALVSNSNLKQNDGY